MIRLTADRLIRQVRIRLAETALRRSATRLLWRKSAPACASSAQPRRISPASAPGADFRSSEAAFSGLGHPATH
jgi:hypothetical protein